MIPPMSETPETPPPAPPSTPTPPPPPAGAGAPNIIRIPILISAIVNCLVALSWLATCFMFFMGIPLIVLAVFEFLLFAKLGDPNYAQHKPRIKLISILEMCSIFFLSIGGLVCGIIVFTNLKQIPDEPGATI